MVIPFTKAHGAKNDFLLTWAAEAPIQRHSEIARAICDRHTGIGADGWYLVRPPDEEADASVKLYNSDGSSAELSGNGTRCAAAFLVAHGYALEQIVIATGAGLKRLKLQSREENCFEFEMEMGRPIVGPEHLNSTLALQRGDVEVTIVDVGNPQCVFFVNHFPHDWAEIGAEVERHSRFPDRTNVSFVRVLGRHLLDVRFFERGAGVTMSSGTGSTGAAAAAIAQGLVDSPVTVDTPAGKLLLEWREGVAHLTGPAEIIGRGEFYFPA
ncbi:MAG TPA: diaminopimelate epimerase [Bryobacteraceae bacterium]|nr:diaminopimelate epimerase [Bryobacteraceae bacterium]